MGRLTEGQGEVLAYLVRRNRERDGDPFAAEISDALGYRTRSWATGKLHGLEKAGLAERTGVAMSSNARCWAATPAGRTALAESDRHE